MLLNEKPDEELMLLYQKGTEEAFQVLYLRHSQKIFGFIKKRIQNHQQCSDIFQEVFIKIHKSKHLYNKDLPVLPWLFTITKNAIIDEVRKTKYQKNQQPIDDLDFAAPDSSPTQIEIPLQLDQIPEKQRSAIQMRYIEDKTFEEIARTLNTSEVNIRKIISRGLKVLKELMEGEKS